MDSDYLFGNCLHRFRRAVCVTGLTPPALPGTVPLWCPPPGSDCCFEDRRNGLSKRPSRASVHPTGIGPNIRMFGLISSTLPRKCAPQGHQSRFPRRRRILKNSLRVGILRPAKRFERSASEMPSAPATCLWLPCWVWQKVRSSSTSSLISGSSILDR